MSSTRLQQIGQSAKSTLAYYARGTYQQIADKLVFVWAQAIAFKVLIAVVPVLILLTGVFGLVMRQDQPFVTVSSYLREFLPAWQSDQLVGILEQLQGASGTLTYVGAIGLLITAVTLFSTLRATIDGVFQEEWHQSRTILGGYLFDLRMVLQVGLLFVLTIALSIAVQTYNANVLSFIQERGLDYWWLQQSWRRFFGFVGYLVPFLLTMGMFFQLFYFIPRPHPPKHAAFVGTMVTAVLWEAAKYGFTFYASYTGRFTRYADGTEDAAAVIGNTFGLVIAFVFWAYFSGTVVLIGAIVALLAETRHRDGRRRRYARAVQQKLAQRQGLAEASNGDEPAGGDGAASDWNEPREERTTDT